MPVIAARENPNTVVGWQNDPDGRGTMGLIWSCILTLTLCVWSALHLNIPPKHDTAADYWLRLTRWVLLGTLAPELVLWAAWRQWGSAKQLTKELGKVLEQVDDEQVTTGDGTKKRTLSRGSSSNLLRRRHTWTQTHSFFVCMGGLVFDREISLTSGVYDDSGISHVGEMDFIPNRLTRLTLTPAAAILLAKCGRLPDIDLNDIKDKSKSDSLAKTLVLLQALWFFASTIARLAQHLPVSLLEVNTIAHVLCTLVVYMLWWNKPREVQEPIVVRGSWVKPLCAYMYMSSRVSGAQYRRGVRPSAWISPELENLTYFAPDPTDEQDVVRSNLADKDAEIQAQRPHGRETASQLEDIKPGGVPGQDFGGFKIEMRRQDTEHTAARKRNLGWEVEVDDGDTTAVKTLRQALCAEAFCEYPAVRDYLVLHPQENDQNSQKKKNDNNNNNNEAPPLEQRFRGVYVPKIHQHVVPAAINWPSDFLLPQLPGQIVGMVLWFVSIMYGSVHLAAWNEFFPTEVEQLLWHMAAGYITASGVWWTIAHILFYLWPWFDTWWDRFVRLKNHWLQYVVYGFLMSCAGTFYILARVYLTIEGIVSLRSAPISTFWTVDWLLFVPHF